MSSILETSVTYAAHGEKHIFTIYFVFLLAFRISTPIAILLTYKSNERLVSKIKAEKNCSRYRYLEQSLLNKLQKILSIANTTIISVYSASTKANSLTNKLKVLLLVRNGMKEIEREGGRR